MMRKGLRYVKSLRSMQRVNSALTRGAATSTLRSLDTANPSSRKFCGFSQNGDVLTRKIIAPTRWSAQCALVRQRTLVSVE